MSDKAEKAPKKKGKLVKILVMVIGALVLVGGGVGAGLYAAGGSGAHEPEDNRPKLVPKSQQKRVSASGEGGEGGEHGAAASSEGGHGGGEGGEKYASNYYAMDKEFTSNLRDSVHFVQVGIAISTPYDDSVISNLKTNDIAIRSAILMTLGDATEEQVFTSDGKRQLQKSLAGAINQTLKEKEGFGGVGNVYFTNFVVQ